MGFRFCCVGSSDSPSAPSAPSIYPPSALTPQPKCPSAPTNHIIDSSASKISSPQTPEQASALYSATATPEPAPFNLSSRKGNISVRRLSSFASPSFEMVSGRTPLGAWHSAAKVVAANRLRGIGGESPVQELRIEELGGQNGKLVFGPVSAFNGQSSVYYFSLDEPR